MKRCPQCNQTFDDDNLNYCLSDGTQLTLDSQPTVVVPKLAAKKKSKALLWLGIIVLVLFVAVVGMAGLLFFFYERSEEARDNRPNVNVSPTPKSSVTPKPTPSLSPTPTTTPGGSPSPSPSGTRGTPTNDDADDITPIAWNTSAATFTGETGKTFKFRCPEKGTPSAIWGSDVYTRDSSICTAAVHMGIITLEQGGVITVEFRPGRSTYGSTVRNGITSNTYGEYPTSFVVR